MAKIFYDQTGFHCICDATVVEEPVRKRTLICSQNPDFLILFQQRKNPWNLDQTGKGNWKIKRFGYCFLVISKEAAGGTDCTHTFLPELKAGVEDPGFHTVSYGKKIRTVQIFHRHQPYRKRKRIAVYDIAREHRVIYIFNINDTNRKAGDILSGFHLYSDGICRWCYISITYTVIHEVSHFPECQAENLEKSSLLISKSVFCPVMICIINLPVIGEKQIPSPSCPAAI